MNRTAFITTYSGRQFSPFELDAASICIEDIAHALSFLCRGNGQVKHFFSVARHCVNCAREAEARGHTAYVVLACLLHDAAEAYLADIPSPVKARLDEYCRCEERVLAMIYQKYLGRVPNEAEERLIKDIDKAMLYYDLKILLDCKPSLPEPKLRRPLCYECVPFEADEADFLSCFQRWHSLVTAGEAKQIREDA